MKFLRNIQPGWIAVVILIAVVLWLASGIFKSSYSDVAAEQSHDAEADVTQPPRQIRVRVKNSEAKTFTREAIVSAQTAPARVLNLQAETSGRVVGLGAKRGAAVTKGQVVIKLAMNDREAQLARAKAVQKQRELQYAAAKRLHKQGHQTDVDLAIANANLLAAEADIDRFQRDIDNVVIRAPFNGILESRPVEVGDYVNVGQDLGRIIQQDPFIIRGHVSEDVIVWLKPGQPGSARLQTGTILEGTLRYIASQADPDIRTFVVELEVSGHQDRLVTGTSVILTLPLEKVVTHELEPVHLTLSKDGEFGVMSVNTDNQVEFHAAKIVQNRNGKVWLTGLPNVLQVITVGQGFVTAGDTVEAVLVRAE